MIWSARESTTVETISYGIGESALGEVLIARTVLGVCAILMGTENDKLVKDLAASFPEAKLVANEHAVHYDLAKLLRFLNKPSEGLDLALDLRGTPFQRHVWQTLRTIPVGRTMTYADLARSIGAPHSVRAVAAACASNPIAIAVPCHRVVGSDGDLTGYRWGIERKRELIEREAMA